MLTLLADVVVVVGIGFDSCGRRYFDWARAGRLVDIILAHQYVFGTLGTLLCARTTLLLMLIERFRRD